MTPAVGSGEPDAVALTVETAEPAIRRSTMRWMTSHASTIEGSAR